MERLQRAVEDAAHGRGALWLLVGEPGIGKTRLVEDCAELARGAGFACAWGRCWESGGAPAFWPWVQAARTLEGVSSRETAPPPAALRSSLRPDSSRASTERLSRFELFDSVAAWLMHLASTRPLFIGLEDLHAADPESLALLEALAVSLRGAPVLIVGTLRDSSLTTGPAAVACKRIARQAKVLALTRLGQEQARELLLSELDTRDEQFIQSAVAATDGHPLFLVELVRQVRLDRADMPLDAMIPQSLNSVFRQRLEQLSQDSVDVLVRAALLGTDVDYDLLQRSFDEAKVEQALAEAMQHGLVRQLGRRSWRFCHAVLRDVLVDTLTREALERAHCQIAEVLLARGDTAAATAHHLHRAGKGQLEAACSASLRAADESLQRFAFEDALAHVSRVQACLASGQDPLSRARARVLESHALFGLGRMDQGRAACLAAADWARQAGSAEVLADAALACGSVFQFASVDKKLVELLEQALELLGPGDSAPKAQLLARLAAARQPDIDPQEPMELAREAVAMAQRVGDTAALVASLRSGCSTLVDLAHPAERRELDERHLELALGLGLDTDELRARLRLVFDCFELADVRTAESHLAQARRLAQSGAHPRYRWLEHALAALRQLWKGEIGGTRALIEAASTLAERAGDGNARLVQLFQMARYIELSGDAGEATRVASGLGSCMSDTAPGKLLSALARARFLLELGRKDDALAAADRATVAAVVANGDRTMLYGAARWAAATGDAELGRTLLRRYDDQRELFVVDGVVGLCWRAPMALVLAHAEMAVGQPRAALSSALAAASAAETARGFPVAAECYGLAASLASGLGNPEQAEAHLARGLALIEGRGLSGLEQRLRAGMLAARTEAATSIQGPHPQEPATSAPNAPPEFQAEGDVVCITWRGSTVRMKTTKGLRVLAELVARPGEPIHVLELVHGGQAHPPVDRGDAGEVLDAKARSAYKERAQHLREELAEAERHADLGRKEALLAELEFVASELSRGSSLAGKARRTPAAEERARQAVQKQIRTTLQNLQPMHAELARYLERSIRTGRICCFEP